MNFHLSNTSNNWSWTPINKARGMGPLPYLSKRAALRARASAAREPGGHIKSFSFQLQEHFKGEEQPVSVFCKSPRDFTQTP